ncbi:MAG TPA: cytochrome P460 family protein, partial [Desulfopila sp.]|nr:cytochrome P460 family protein [Desulfopila sp.]
MRRLLLFSVLVFIGGITATLLYAAISESPAQKLWKRITVEAPYSHWHHVDNHLSGKKSGTPSAPYYRIYVNDIKRDAGSTAIDFGTIFVRENLSAEKILQGVTVMAKIEGYNSGAGDWFWAKYSAEGQVEEAGKVKECLGCHSFAADNDYIFD